MQQAASALRAVLAAPSGRRGKQSVAPRSWAHRQAAGRRQRLACRAVIGEDSEKKPVDTQVKTDLDSLKKKVSLLDSVLGTQDEPVPDNRPPPRVVKAEASTSSTDANTKVEISGDLWEKMRAADSARDAAKKESTSADEEMSKILDSMKKIGDKQGLSEDEQAKMRKEFENLLSTIATTPIIPNDDIQKMKEQVFRQSTFWVTGTESVLEYPGAILFKGNLRGTPRDVYLGVRSSMATNFGTKYEVMMVDEPRLGRPPDTAGGIDVKPAFVVMAADLARPRPTAGWQYGAAVILAFISCLSAVEVGLETQVALLPKETLEFFANPSNLDNLPPGAIIPGFDKFDPLTFVEHAIPVALGITLCAVAHEAGHRFVASQKKVDLGPSFYIPNGDLGTFGAVTPIKTLLPGREDLFDIAAAGPLAGGAMSLGMFVFGLAASKAGGGVEAGLLPVPGSLFNGSLLLGGISSAVLGSGKQVLVHPALVAGWCGLVSTAFNLLPMGRTDGGRMAMAAYGRRSLSVTSILSYLGLAIGILGGDLALNWGLYVLIVQRDPETAPLDDITAVDEKRTALAGALVAVSLAVLLPLGSSF